MSKKLTAEDFHTLQKYKLLKLFTHISEEVSEEYPEESEKMTANFLIRYVVPILKKRKKEENKGKAEEQKKKEEEWRKRSKKFDR